MNLYFVLFTYMEYKIWKADFVVVMTFGGKDFSMQPGLVKIRF